MAQERHIQDYLGFRIIANEKGSRVYTIPKKDKKSKELYAYDGSGLEICISKAEIFINERCANRDAKRRAPHIGTVDDYIEALEALSLGDHEQAMLTAHRKSSNRRMTAEELAASAGWDGFSSANSHYGKLGQRIAYHLGLNINSHDDQAWTEALATFDETTRQWEMHEELASAIDRLNMS